MPWTRRSLLLAGAAIAAGAATSGCTPADPRVSGSARPTTGPSVASPPAETAPPATPTPTVPGIADAASVELGLAGRLTALTTKRLRRDLEPSARRALDSIRAAHLDHAAALLGPAPTSRAVDDTPKPEDAAVPPSLRRGLRRLARAEQAAADRYRRSALAGSGFTALLFGSLSVAATTFASAVVDESPGTVAPAGSPQPMPRLSDVEAMAEMVRQLHAAVYGYQLAIGQLKVGSGARDRALSGLQTYRVLRDRLTTALIERSAKIPVAEPAYVPTVRPRNPETASELIMTIEVALTPFCGLWLASAGTATERGQAFGALAGAVATGRRWGAPMTVWPGWTA